MRNSVVLLFLLSYGILAQAQSSEVVKVKIVEPGKLFIAKHDRTVLLTTDIDTKLSLVYKRRRSTVKKHLFFDMRRGRVKVV